jgi:hypothetical protein
METGETKDRSTDADWQYAVSNHKTIDPAKQNQGNHYALSNSDEHGGNVRLPSIGLLR